MAEIAVIIPVYNAGTYLRGCLESVLGQSFRDLKLVLVDDGSSDDSGAVCDVYAEADDRVQVIHQKNRGPSAARNRGIELALSEKDCRFIAFVDSDDRIHPQYLEYLHGMAAAWDAQIAMCRHRYVTPTEPLPDPEELPKEKGRIVDAETLMCEECSSFNYAWGKLFSIDCFARLRFPENVHFGEDNLTVYKAFFACDRTAFSERMLYYYYYNPEGITKTHWNPGNLQCCMGFEEQLLFYGEHGYERAFRKEKELYIQQCAYQLHRIREDKERLKENKKHIRGLRNRMKQLLKESPELRIKDNDYWFEAMHPNAAKFKGHFVRLQRNMKKHGLAGTVKKIRKKVKQKDNKA